MALAPDAARQMFWSIAVGCLSLWRLRHFVQGYWFDRHCKTDTNLVGKVALVTGATVGGLGCEVAAILAEMGAKVVITCRTKAKAKAAVAYIEGRARNGKVISVIIVDFLSVSSVVAAAKKFKTQETRLDFLVLNAGVADGSPADVWMTNVVGPWIFTEELRPVLAKTAKIKGMPHNAQLGLLASKDAEVRVVAVSSGVHKGARIADDPTTTTKPYGQSKLAQIMLVRELQRQMRAADPEIGGEEPLRGIAVTPGMVITAMVGDAVKGWMNLLWPIVLLVGRSRNVGAQSIKAACVDAVPGGSYISSARPAHEPRRRAQPYAAAAADPARRPCARRGSRARRRARS